MGEKKEEMVAVAEAAAEMEAGEEAAGGETAEMVAKAVATVAAAEEKVIEPLFSSLITPFLRHPYPYLTKCHEHSSLKPTLKKSRHFTSA